MPKTMNNTSSSPAFAATIGLDWADKKHDLWIQAAGEYLESGKTKRVAVSIGPEHGTVGPDHVKEAAKAAVGGADEKKTQ